MKGSGEKKAVVRLCELGIGDRGRLKRSETCGTLRRRLLDMGFIEGAEIECVGKSPMGDPAAYFVRGAVIALRKRDSRAITVDTERG